MSKHRTTNAHKLNIITKELKHMSQELDQLTAQVKANSDAADSAIALINGIADRITAAGTDPQKLNDLTTELKNKDTALAAAVTANTPAQKTP
jgi:hypothetical protein